MKIGSVSKVSKTTYRLRYFKDGTHYSKNIEASSLKEAKQKANDYINDVLNFKIESTTFKDLVEKYMNEYYIVNFRPQVVKSTNTCIKNYLLPFFKDYYINEITPEIVNTFVNKLKNTKASNKDSLLSEKSIKNYYDNLKAIMNYAVRMEYINSNPCEKIKLNLQSLKQNHEIHYYDSDQTKLLLEAIQSEPKELQLAILLALYCGMRKSEIYGLKWTDINEDTIHIQRSNVSNKIGQTKTATSNRSLTLPSIIINLLKEIPKDNESQFVLPYSYNIARQLHRIQKKCNLPIIRFHDLRHTSATLLLTSGVDIKTISEFLGHSNISTTSIYVHSLDKNFKKISDQFSDLLSINQR